MIVKYLSSDECIPPHVDVPSKTDQIINSIREKGWDGPNLIGYHWQNTIQLLSGSHRYAACRYLNIKMPVVVISYEYVKSAWGDEKLWCEMMSLGKNLVG